MLERFPELDAMKVIDLGGGAPPPAGHVWGDACTADELFAERSFDLVVSNSVLEHVGGYHRRQEFARAVHWLADRHWVQTPNLYFPMEPHWLFPMMQFLPFDLRVLIARRWHLGHVRAGTIDQAIAEVASCELVSASELRHLFPGSILWRERLLGVTKSLVAIRT